MVALTKCAKQVILLLITITLITSCNEAQPVKVGILHSLTGDMAVSEKALVDVLLLEIEEINRKGGLLGRKIEPVVRDAQSNWDIFRREAEDLIEKEHVAVVFGCWTSASRKTVKPIFEKNNHLLFYPVQYEGLEDSPNIIYTGATPNQQIIPTIKWSMDNLGATYYLVGSDYIFPKVANKIIKKQLQVLNGRVVGESFTPLGSTDFDAIVQKIKRAEPTVILNTLNGNSNVHFFKALRKAGISSHSIPTISFSLGENELKEFEKQFFAGDYAAWNYFQSVNSKYNDIFINRFLDKFGKHRVITDPMEATYIGFNLWIKTVKKLNSYNVSEVRKELRGMNFVAPQGVITVDYRNNHIWKWVRIGKIRPDGQFTIVWESDKPVKPYPYPGYATHQEWNSYLDGLYEGWGKSWGVRVVQSETIN